MWDVSRQEGSAAFEQEAVTALAAWRAGRFELPDYYLDEVIETARRFYPDSLAEGTTTGPPPATPEAGRVRAG
jgi:ferric-dicitrate binding protein FerR (iron transport regulator)